MRAFDRRAGEKYGELEKAFQRIEELESYCQMTKTAAEMGLPQRKTRFDFLEDKITDLNIDLKQEMSVYTGKIDIITAITSKLNEDIYQQGKTTSLTNDNNDKMVQSIDHLHAQFRDFSEKIHSALEENHAGCIKRTHENNRMATLHEHKLEAIDIWKRNELARKLELLMNFHDGFSATQIYFNKTITEIRLMKADSAEF